MTASKLIQVLQKLVEEHPETASNTIFIEWEGNSGQTLERDLQAARFRFTNGLTPEIVLST